MGCWFCEIKLLEIFGKVGFGLIDCKKLGLTGLKIFKEFAGPPKLPDGKPTLVAEFWIKFLWGYPKLLGGKF